MSKGVAFALIVYAMLPLALVVSVAIYLWKSRKMPAHKRDLSNSELIKGIGGMLLVLLAGPPLAAAIFYGAAYGLATYMAHPQDAKFAAAAAGCGLLTGLFAVYFTAVNWKVSRWPSTRGRIVSVRVVPAFRRGRSTFYTPGVRYRYEVKGQRYHGDRLRWGGGVYSNVRQFAEDTIAKYPVGSEVDVHYNPQDPKQSVLHRNSYGHYLLWLITASLFALAIIVATGTLRVVNSA